MLWIYKVRTIQYVTIFDISSNHNVRIFCIQVLYHISPCHRIIDALGTYGISLIIDECCIRNIWISVTCDFNSISVAISKQYVP